MSLTSTVKSWIVAALVCVAAAGFSAAEVFVVFDDSDQIPAMEGTLRWAIEQSEINPGPDSIEFAIDFANIELVAPLPDLTDGGLTILHPSEILKEPGRPSAYTITASADIERALAIRSPENRIGELRFVNFSGPEVILVSGSHAHGTLISGCWFGDPDTGEPGGSDAAVRIAQQPGGNGVPESVRLVACGFDDNGTAVVIDGGPSSTVPELRHPPTIRRCWFGTSSDGGPGPGNHRAMSVTGAPVRVLENHLSGPGEGIHLLAGAHDSLLRRNIFGASRPDGTVECRALTPSAVFVERARNIVFDGNEVRCATDGITLGVGADDAFVNQNLFQSPAPGTFPGSAVVLAGGSGGLVSRNSIHEIDGDGIRSDSEAGPVNILTCNRISRIGGRPIAQVEPQVPPPDLLGSGPLTVSGQVSTDPPGWIEIFTDETEEANRFMGAMEVLDPDLSFEFLLPAGLRIEETGAGTALGVSGDLAAHTATWTPSDLGETSELSAPLPVGELPPLFDLLRGNVANLTPALAGGVDLGPVDCLAKGAGEGFPVVTDDTVPEPGESFFYLSRRRHPDAVAEVGSYNPPLCLDLLDGSLGERIEGPGGCDN